MLISSPTESKPYIYDYLFYDFFKYASVVYLKVKCEKVKHSSWEKPSTQNIRHVKLWASWYTRAGNQAP